MPRHHSRPSERLSLSIIPSTGKRSSRESRSASRALMRDAASRHPPHASRTRSGHITHLQPCAATHEKSAPRELHPAGHARRIHSLQTVCINRSLSTAPVDIDLFLRTVFDHSLTEMQHILRACPLFIQKNITKRLSDNRKNHYLCIHNHSTASLKRRSEAHTSPPSPLSTKQ